MYHLFFNLAGRKPVAVGKTRYIYEHPDNPDWLIKVHRSMIPDQNLGRFKTWYARMEDRFVYMTGYLRELAVYLDSRYGAPEGIIKHIAPIGGLVDTDLGIGLVVSAVRDGSGELAPTLGQLINNGQINEQRYQKLMHFLEIVLTSKLVLGDLNLENVVLEQQEDGTEEFVLIDGLGERTFIPVQIFSKRIRQKRKLKFVQRVMDRLKSINAESLKQQPGF
ncbi:YrbL family protein [Gynuella sp.]|uniref:YrbL family protein n=1 Tax=Gynuella sp. TaxID=2969146 RepID=UPI003D12861D